MSLSQRADLIEKRLAELDALDPDSLTPEQFAEYAQLRREREWHEQDQASEQERQRDAAEQERQQAEYTQAFARHRSGRADREKLLAEADEHDRLAAELRALYHAGGSWADVTAPHPADRATVLTAHAVAAGRPRARLTLREALSKVRIATIQAGHDPDTLTADQTAELLADMKNLSPILSGVSEGVIENRIKNG